MNGDEKYHMYEALDTITIRLRVQGIICTRKSGKTGTQAVQKVAKLGSKQSAGRKMEGNLDQLDLSCPDLQTPSSTEISSFNKSECFGEFTIYLEFNRGKDCPDLLTHFSL